MKKQEHYEIIQPNYQKQKSRSSGRVGRQLGMVEVGIDSEPKPSNPNEILNIYQRLFDLRDHDTSELSGAIMYGLKLSGNDKDSGQKRKSFIRRFMMHI